MFYSANLDDVFYHYKTFLKVFFLVRTCVDVNETNVAVNNCHILLKNFSHVLCYIRRSYSSDVFCAFGVVDEKNAFDDDDLPNYLCFLMSCCEILRSTDFLEFAHVLILFQSTLLPHS